MKRRRNTEKICSATPTGNLARTKHEPQRGTTAWERAVAWANANPKYA